MRWKRTSACALCAMALLGLAPPDAEAETIQVTLVQVNIITPTEYQLVYRADLENSPPSALVGGSTFADSSFFTVFDFEGYVAGSAQFINPGGAVTTAADWDFSTVNVGPVPVFQGPTDDATEANLTWRYDGTPTGTVSGGDAFLGYFAANTMVLTGSDGLFSGQDWNSTLAKWQGNTGPILVPDADSTTPLPVPVPLAAVAGVGLFGLVGAVRRKTCC